MRKQERQDEGAPAPAFGQKVRLWQSSPAGQGEFSRLAIQRKIGQRTRTRRRRQHKHVVDLRLAARDIAKLGAAVTFRVKSKGAMLGTIEIGQGAFAWRGAHGKSLRRLPWPRFFERLERR